MGREMSRGGMISLENSPLAFVGCRSAKLVRFLLIETSWMSLGLTFRSCDQDGKGHQAVHGVAGLRARYNLFIIFK